MSNEDRRKWDERYQAVGFEVAPPSAVVRRLLARLGYFAAARPEIGNSVKSPRALDVAAGAGRHSLLLSQLGFNVTAVDISAPGLAIAKRRAEAAGLPLSTVCLDLDESPLPSGPWDLILCTMFLDRTLFGKVANVLASAGHFVYVQPTRTNLTRHEKPPADFLLLDGELPDQCSAAGLELAHYEEGWLEDGRHDACAIGKLRSF